MTFVGQKKQSRDVLRGYRRRDVLRLFGTGCVVTFCVLLIHVLRPELFTHFEHKVFDVLLAQTAKRPPSPIPVLIAIDDKALARLGQWPWPRHHLAHLVDRLHESGADVVALDMVLSTQDRTSPQTVRDALKHESGLELKLDHIPRQFHDHDHLLAQNLAMRHSILGFKLLFTPMRTEQNPCLTHPLPPTAPWPEAFSLFTAQDVLCNLDILTKAAADTGFINALPDTDGVLRRVPLIAVYEDRLLPSLALSMARAKSHDLIGLGQDLDGGFVQFGRNRIHADFQGAMLLRYKGPKGTYGTYSVSDILDSPLPDLSGRIAIVGPTAAGLGDNHITPTDRFFPGIEIHATMLDNILSGDHLVSPAWALGAEACAVIAVGVLSSLLMMIAGPLSCVVILACGAVGLWSASLWLLNYPGYWICPLSAELVLILNMAILSLIKYGMEERELRIRSQQLVQVQDATILSLTALAETRDPETGGHIKRTREYVLVLARCLARKPKYRQILNRNTVELLHKSAPLHDIGKVGISDAILLKPGCLTDEERTAMQRHASLGRKPWLKRNVRHSTVLTSLF